MVSGIWGKKIGMTQLFSGDKVVPVTAIDVGNWVVTGFKTTERDGYNAIQVGCPRKRYANQKPSADWMKNLQQYFSFVREIRVEDLPENLSIGQPAELVSHLKEGEQINVFGTSKGKGFAGVVKRWDFGGPPASHGSTMGNRTGSIGFMRSQGKVIKGKKMPGHLGVERLAVKNLDVVKIAEDAPVIFVKGAVPGHAGSLVFIQRQVK
jgi:large subunit ribosomal protein L3